MSNSFADSPGSSPAGPGPIASATSAPSAPPPAAEWSHPPVVPTSKTNVLAVISLITGILGISIAALVTGIIGLKQIKRSGERGRGMAIAGLVLAAVWFVVGILVSALLVVGVVVATEQALQDTSTPTAAAPTAPGDAADADAALTEEPSDYFGYTPSLSECVNDEGSAGLTRTDCSLPHDLEVYDVEQFTSFSGEEQMVDTADAHCIGAFRDFVGIDYDYSTLGVAYLYPSADSWAHGDRTVTCLVGDYAGAKTTGSLQGAAI